jgi:uncharacterized repeat protein (TIGR03803 family)
MKIKVQKDKLRKRTLGEDSTDCPAFMRTRLAMLLAAAAVWFFFIRGIDAQAQPRAIFQSLYSFTNGTDGASPYAGLVVAGETLYGTTHGGGAYGNGTVFALNTNGTDFRVLHTFAEWDGRTNLDGAEPYGGLVLSSNTLYGTTFEGGTADVGTVFALNTAGTGFTTVHDFNEDDGGSSYAGLIIAGSTLYGTSLLGYPKYAGNVFAVNTNGTDFTPLYNFSDVGTGKFPYAGLLLSGSTLYGTTVQGGTNDNSLPDYETGGTVFSVNTDGTGFATLHTFLFDPDGWNPTCNLVLSGNMLYGTASSGGANSNGTVFGVNTNGTGFTVLHTFNGSDGTEPNAGLVLSGNTLYGTTGGGGGTNGAGTVFAVNTDGTGFTILHTFQGSDGALLSCGLVLSGNTLYGTTFEGGSSNAGTVFAITLPSLPVIDPSSMVVSGGQLQFVVTGLSSNATVYVQASSDLSSTNYWAPVTTNVTTATNLTISGLSVTNANHRFFRVLETSPP